MIHSGNISIKLFGIGFIAAICLVASLLVLGLVAEREERYGETQDEVRSAWGLSQTLVGPMLVFETPTPGTTTSQKTYVLPKKLTIEKTLEPETRSRGIFDTVVYTEKIQVNGTFSSKDTPSSLVRNNPTFVVSLTDTRSIEKQMSLRWNGSDFAFLPGTTNSFLGDAGLHSSVPLSYPTEEYSFSFELTLRGSGETMVAPVGQETVVSVSSPWPDPEFTGAYLPSTRSITEDGFSATWNVSSFGRDYPQTWIDDGSVSRDSLVLSSFGVSLYEGVDLYTQVFRSTKYAVLFILITFTVFFLFEILAKLRIHPIQYLLVGAALALFYLLLLSLFEHVGFLAAYIIATLMTVTLITGYSIRVLKQKTRAALMLVLLSSLYAYLYFVLKLEDYALLFGALLVFVLLAFVMYATRNIDWFALSNGKDTEK